MSYFKQEKPPICFHRVGQPLVDHMFEEGKALYRAAAVIAKDTKIRAWLSKNNPKALEQLDGLRGIND